MKKILFVLLIVVIACKSTKELKTSSENSLVSISENPNYKEFRFFKGDTLKYLLTNFSANQDYYLGKPLNVLLDDLELPINYYHFSTSAKNVNLIPSLGLSPYQRNQVNKKILKKENPLLFYVTWVTPLPSDRSNELLRKNNGNWTDEEIKYYGEFKIKEIKVSNY